MFKHRLTYLVPYLLSFFITAFLLSCFRDTPTNPYIEDYPGDYRYEIIWDSLTVVDTLELFRPYVVPFRVTGGDWFSGFYVSDSTGAVICDSVHFPVHDDDTAMTFYFTGSFSGRPVVHGIRPNGKEVDTVCPAPIEVINPYRLVVEEVEGISSVNTAEVVKRHNPAEIPDSLRTIWTIHNAVDTALGLIKSYTAPSTDFTVSAVLVDKYRNTLGLGTVSVTVKGYSPVIDTVIINESLSLGEKADFSISVFDADSSGLRVYAFINGKELFATPRVFPYSSFISVETDREVSDTGAVVFSVYVRDTTGLKSNVYTLNTAAAYSLPLPVFPSGMFTVPQGKGVTFKVYDANYTAGTTYRWRFLRLGIDSVVSSDSFRIMYTDTLPDTVIVTGTDRYGYTGRADTAVIMPSSYTYILEKGVFPASVVSGEFSLFTVKVSEVGSDPVMYYWSVEDEHQLDTLYIRDDTLMLSVSDTVRSFLLSVFAVVGGTDTTNTLVERIGVKVLPRCEFSEDGYSVLLGDSVSFSVLVNSVVDSVYMRFDTGAVIALGSDTSCVKVFTERDTFPSYAWAVDSMGSVSDTDTVIVSVYSEPPYFIPDSGDTFVFINDTATIRVNAYAGNSLSVITGYFWDTDGDGEWDDTTSTAVKKVVKLSQFDGVLHAGCVNDLGDTAVEYYRYHLSVSGGLPVIDTAYTDTNWSYINDTVRLVQSAYDVNGNITALQVDTNGDSESDIVVSGLNGPAVIDTVELVFPHPGVYGIRVCAVDDDFQSSAWYSAGSVTVDAGIPRVIGLLPDTVWIYDSTVYTIAAIDNGSIVDYAWSQNAVDYISLGEVNTFTHSFCDSGYQYVYVRVTDNDGNVSPVHKDSVYVVYGAPVIDGVDLDTVWVFDTNTYTFNFHDVNGSVERMEVDWGDGSKAEVNDISGTSHALEHSYAVSGDTSYLLLVTVIDNDSIMVTGSFIVYVLPGEPSVDSIWIDTTGNNLFVVDNRKYHVRASDPNGYVRKVYFSIDGDSIAESTVVIPYNSALVDTFIWNSWEVTNSGAHTLRYWVEDEDGVFSTNRDTSVYVRLCTPVLWGDDGDTTWVVVDSGAGENYTLHINCFDTNGVFTRFYWHEAATFDSASGSCVKTDDSARTRLIGALEVNNGWQSWIYGRDDDGLLGGGRFVVYADSVPPMVTGLSADMQDGGDSVRLMWGLQLDRKDSIDTEIKIMIKYSDNGDPDSTLVDFTPAGEFRVTGGNKRYFKFKKVQSGDIRWRVVLRDKRGSETGSDVAPFTIQ